MKSDQLDRLLHSTSREIHATLQKHPCACQPGARGTPRHFPVRFASSGVHWVQGITLVVVKGIGLVIAIGLLIRYVLPRLYRHASRSVELLTTLAIGWAVALAAIGDLLGFRK